MESETLILIVIVNIQSIAINLILIIYNKRILKKTVIHLFLI